MAGKLAIDVAMDGETWVVALKGAIDEDAELSTGLKGVSGRVRFEMAAVSGINSCGVREWINVLREMDGRVMAIEYASVSVPMVQQFNMILNARGIGKVMSFFAPYFCGACRKPREMLLKIEEHKELQKVGELAAPARKCPQCDQELEFDEIDEKYLNFLDLQLKEKRR